MRGEGVDIYIKPAGTATDRGAVASGHRRTACARSPSFARKVGAPCKSRALCKGKRPFSVSFRHEPSLGLGGYHPPEGWLIGLESRFRASLCKRLVTTEAARPRPVCPLPPPKPGSARAGR